MLISTQGLYHTNLFEDEAREGTIEGMIIFDEEKEENELAEIKQKEEKDLLRLLAEKHNLPYINLLPLPIETDALRLLPEEEARAAKVAPFSITGKKVAVAVFSPDTAETRAALQKISEAGYIPTVYMTEGRGLEKAWGHYKELSSGTKTRAGTMDILGDTVAETAAAVRTLSDLAPKVQEIIHTKQANRISQLVEIILGGAIAIDASDVHIEPEELSVRLRFRLDGILREVLTFDQKTYALINSRIKLLSGLKLNIKNEAQDGRFSVNLKDMSMEIRASVLPGAYGESIVLRLLNPKTIAVPLEELGMQPVLLEIVEQEISKPNGMLLTTGPTGSGKTTTLYAFLRKILTPGVKIITIEDPIEYHLSGITQTQTDTDHEYTFAAGLRSALRQDPDIIMVGEIRDKETAEIAINAALTGHLVFSTLHTNNAAGSFPRLIDLGVNSKVITSAINLVMAQRLVRKLCQECKERIAIKEKGSARINALLKTLAQNIQVPQRAHMWKAKGCAACHDTGYKGRTGIYEAIKADQAIEKAVRDNPSEREIVAAAAAQNIPDMRQDGILKVLSGITSLEELERVIDLEI